MIDLHFPYGRDESALTILYEYDFGDNWRHMLRWSASRARKVCNILAVSPANGSGPPEDVGGTSGYADFLDAWLDPEHDEHKAMRRWVGRKFHPETCNLDDINKAIAKAMRVSKGNYRFRRESA